MGVAEGAPSGESDVIVGYALTEKKCRSLFSPELINEARAKGVHFLPIDPSRPIEDQAGHPFDVVLQKIPASSPHKKEWDARVEAYATTNPDAYVVDLPAAVRRVANRGTMLDAVRAVELATNPASAAPVSAAVPAGTAHAPETYVVRAPKQILAIAGTEQQVRAQVDAASLRFPLLAKSMRADGSSDSHKVAIIHDQDGLACVVQGAVPGLKPPCVIQEYVNHGGCLFKVYVVGDDVTMTRRKSLPDLRGARASRRRRAAAEKAAELAAARGSSDLPSSGPAASRDPRGTKPRVPGIAAGGVKDDTADVDGDVDDSEEDLDDDEGEGEEGDGSARRRRRATGAQSVSRVSCFRGGATEGETSWRDRLTEDERRRMACSPRVSEESPLESPSPLRLRQSFARNLTISRVGSVDSIGGSSVVSEHPSVARDLDGEGDGSGDSASSTLGTGTGMGTGRSGGGLPPLAPGESRRSRDALRNARRAGNGSFGAGSDFTFTTSDGGTESEAGDGGEELSPGMRVRTAQESSFRPEILRERVEPESPARESADGGEKKFVAAPRDDFVTSLALTLRDELGLSLFNFDLIRVDGDKDEFLVVDINYFPGIAKMPGYSDTFCRFLRRAKQKEGSGA